VLDPPFHAGDGPRGAGSKAGGGAGMRPTFIRQAGSVDGVGEASRVEGVEHERIIEARKLSTLVVGISNVVVDLMMVSI
jgi:hypothetical protein